MCDETGEGICLSGDNLAWLAVYGHNTPAEISVFLNEQLDKFRTAEVYAESIKAVVVEPVENVIGVLAGMSRNVWHHYNAYLDRLIDVCMGTCLDELFSIEAFTTDVIKSSEGSIPAVADAVFTQIITSIVSGTGVLLNVTDEYTAARLLVVRHMVLAHDIDSYLMARLILSSFQQHRVES